MKNYTKWDLSSDGALHRLTVKRRHISVKDGQFYVKFDRKKCRLFSINGSVAWFRVTAKIAEYLNPMLQSRSPFTVPFTKG